THPGIPGRTARFLRRGREAADAERETTRSQREPACQGGDESECAWPRRVAPPDGNDSGRLRRPPGQQGIVIDVIHSSLLFRRARPSGQERGYRGEVSRDP